MAPTADEDPPAAAVDDAPDLGDEALEARLRQARGSSDAGVWEDLAADLCEEWRLEEAEECARRAMDLGRPAAAFYLGLAFVRQDRDAEAIQAYEIAISAGVQEAVLNQGVVWQCLGELERARHRYLEAVDAGDPLGHIRLGQLLEADGDLAGAEEQYRLASADRWPSAPSALGMLLAKQERWDLAEPLLRRAAADPDDADARSWHGLTLRRLGKVSQARQVLQDAVDAAEWESLIPLGNLLRDEADDIAGAEDAYRRARAAGDPHAHLNLGLLLLETGRPHEAHPELLLAVEAQPDSTTARAALDAATAQMSG